MTYIDISHPLSADIAVWPGDTSFSRQLMMRRQAGDSVNLSTLTFSAHTGTHIDAPHHFADDAPALDALDLRPYWGPAQVVAVGKASGALVPEDFAGYDLSLAPRLLVRTPASQLPHTQYPSEIVYLSPELVAHLAAYGIILYGTDAPSMDAMDSKTLPGHNALYAHGIAILEGLKLIQVENGLYELVALPLNIQGGDGSPVRAVLRKL